MRARALPGLGGGEVLTVEGAAEGLITPGGVAGRDGGAMVGIDPPTGAVTGAGGIGLFWW